MLQNREQQYKTYFLFAIGTALVFVLALVVWSVFVKESETIQQSHADANTVQPAVVVPPVDPAQQVAAYVGDLDGLLGQDDISDTDMQVFLFETRVPPAYREKHLLLAQYWAGEPRPDARALLMVHQQSLAIE